MKFVTMSKIYLGRLHDIAIVRLVVDIRQCMCTVELHLTITGLSHKAAADLQKGRRGSKCAIDRNRIGAIDGIRLCIGVIGYRKRMASRGIA